MQQKRETLSLDNSLYLFEGSNRRCFLHPDNADLCIKVLHATSLEKTRRRELAYFQSLEKRLSDWSNIARLIGVVSTNLGDGAVFNLVKDHDGKISKTLHHYLSLNDHETNRWAVVALEQLKQQLFYEGVVFRDLNALNILVQWSSPVQRSLVVVDGIGHNDFVPLVNISRSIARKKIVRVWNRKMDYWFSHYPEVFAHIKPFET